MISEQLEFFIYSKYVEFVESVLIEMEVSFYNPQKANQSTGCGQSTETKQEVETPACHVN